MGLVDGNYDNLHVDSDDDTGGVDGDDGSIDDGNDEGWGVESDDGVDV